MVNLRRSRQGWSHHWLTASTASTCRSSSQPPLRFAAGGQQVSSPADMLPVPNDWTYVPERKITLRLDADDDQYAHIVNAVWMLLRATEREYTVEPDKQADQALLDQTWDSYSEVSWEGGGDHGTPQSEAARGLAEN
jgi:hypothetical protein